MNPTTYLAVALLYVAAALVIFRVFVRRDYLRRGKLSLPSVILEWVIFCSWGVFTWVDLPARFPPADVGVLPRVLGYAALVIGMSGLVAGIAYLGFRRSSGLEVNILQQSGPYRFTRNPQVVACTLAVVGYALLWPSWHTLGWVALYAVAVHTMVLTEEEHLQHIHGEAFARYRARVPRYLGYRRTP